MIFISHYGRPLLIRGPVATN